MFLNLSVLAFLPVSNKPIIQRSSYQSIEVKSFFCGSLICDICLHWHCQTTVKMFVKFMCRQMYFLHVFDIRWRLFLNIIYKWHPIDSFLSATSPLLSWHYFSLLAYVVYGWWSTVSPFLPLSLVQLLCNFTYYVIKNADKLPCYIATKLHACHMSKRTVPHLVQKCLDCLTRPYDYCLRNLSILLSSLGRFVKWLGHMKKGCLPSKISGCTHTRTKHCAKVFLLIGTISI